MKTNYTTQPPYGNNEKPASFAIAVLAMALLLAIIANNCSAQTGYRYCVNDSSGIWCGNTINLNQAIDSLSAWSGLPAAFFNQQLQASHYIYIDTAASAIYIERKHYVKTRKNGTIKLRRSKPCR